MNDNTDSNDVFYMKRYEGILKEYESLRAEMIAQFVNRNNVLMFGSATLALLFNVAASIDTSKYVDKNPFNYLLPLKLKAIFIMLAITIPLMCCLIIFLWGSYSTKVANISSYLMDIEEDMNKFLKYKAFKWQKHQRESIDDGLRQAMAITIIFSGFSLASICFAFQMGSDHFCPNKLCGTFQNSNTFTITEVLSWSFLISGFLVGDYRMYLIHQSFIRKSGEKKEKKVIQFFILSKVLCFLYNSFKKIKAILKV